VSNSCIHMRRVCAFFTSPRAQLRTLESAAQTWSVVQTRALSNGLMCHHSGKPKLHVKTQHRCIHNKFRKRLRCKAKHADLFVTVGAAWTPAYPAPGPKALLLGPKLHPGRREAHPYSPQTITV